MDFKKSTECLQMYQNSPTPSQQQTNVKLIAVNPLNIIIEPSRGSVEKKLEIKNVYPCRIAYRIKCNGPTRYVVCPNKGFLSNGEKTMIDITLIDGNKYQSNHSFVVQAIPAPGDFTDRRLIWKRENILGIWTNTRIRTMRPALPNKKDEVARSSSSSECGSMTTTTTTASSNPPSAISSVSDVSINPIDHGEFKEKIDEFTEQLKKLVDEKKNKASEMVTEVNEIKSIEVELDRHAQTLNALNQRLKNGEIQYSNLVLIEMKLREDINRVKGISNQQ